MVTIEDDFLWFTMVNAPWIAFDMLSGPYANISDGHMDICYLSNTKHKSNTKRLGTFALGALGEEASGDIFDREDLVYIKTKKFSFEPLHAGSYMNIDGELIEYAKVDIAMLPQKMKIICHRNVDTVVKAWSNVINDTNVAKYAAACAGPPDAPAAALNPNTPSPHAQEQVEGVTKATPEGEAKAEAEGAKAQAETQAEAQTETEAPEPSTETQEQ